jgi:hypothetical protein
MKTNYLFSHGIAYQNLFSRGFRRLVVLLLIFPSLVYAQPTPKNWEVARDVGNGCKEIVHKLIKFDLVWTGECKEGYANGIGISKIYENGKLTTISKVLKKNGREDANYRAEQYGIDDEIGLFYSMRAPGEAWTKDAAVPPSQVPEWAREIVDGRPRQSTPANVASKQPAQKSSSTTASSSQAGSSGGTKRMPLRAGFNVSLYDPNNSNSRITVSSVIAGRGESEMKRNAEALVRAWLPKSTWAYDESHIQGIQLGKPCGGPGLVFEARLNLKPTGATRYPSVGAGYVSGCFDSYQGLSSAVAGIWRNASEAAAGNDWWFEWIAVAYIDENNFHGPSHYSQVFSSNSHAMVEGLVDRRFVSYECHKRMRGSNPQQSTLVSCLRETYDALRR